MPVRLPASGAPRRSETRDGPRLALAGSAILGIAVFAFSALSLPAGLVLPVLSLAAIPVAIVSAVLAWLHAGEPRSDRITYWDVAGGVALVGIGASVLADPMQIVSLR